MILKILRIPGIICLIYYFIIVYYSGFNTDFSFIWVLAGGLLLFLPNLNQLRIRLFKESIGSLVIKYGFIAGVVVGLLVFVIIGSAIISGMVKQPSPNCKYIIVLGAQVRGETPSRLLKMRLTTAYNYLAENPETQAILSGGQGPGEDITEAECMRRYLVDLGINEGRLILEDQSTDTHENLMFSRDKIVDLRDQIGVISNDFHIYRAVQIAKKQGFTNISGISAASDPLMEPHFFTREVIAILKDKFIGNI